MELEGVLDRRNRRQDETSTSSFRPFREESLIVDGSQSDVHHGDSSVKQEGNSDIGIDIYDE